MTPTVLSGMVFVAVSCVGVLLPIEEIGGRGAVVYFLLQDAPLLLLLHFSLRTLSQRELSDVLSPANRKRTIGALLCNGVIAAVALLATETKGMSLVLLGTRQFAQSSAAMHFEASAGNLLSLPWLFASSTIVTGFVFGYVFRRLERATRLPVSFIVLPLLFAVHHLRFGKEWLTLPLFAETFFVGVFFTALVRSFRSVFAVWPFLVLFEIAYYVVVDVQKSVPGLLANGILDLVIIAAMAAYLSRRGSRLAVESPPGSPSPRGRR